MMRKRGFLWSVAVIAALVFMVGGCGGGGGGGGSAAPGGSSEDTNATGEYLFDNPQYYTGSNLISATDLSWGKFVTQGGNEYTEGLSIGDFALTSESTPENYSVIAELPGDLHYSRNDLQTSGAAYRADLNALYSSLKAILAPSMIWSSIAAETLVGNVRILCDGIEVFSKTINKGDNDEKIDIDLTGVQTLQIFADGIALGFLNPYLYKDDGNAADPDGSENETSMAIPLPVDPNDGAWYHEPIAKESLKTHMMHEVSMKKNLGYIHYMDTDKYGNDSAPKNCVSKRQSDLFAIDLNLGSGAADFGKQVFAIADGEINYINAKQGYIEIKHTGPLKTDNPIIDEHVKNVWYSGYMHLDITGFEHYVGKPINRLDPIGKVSDKGLGNGAYHLHFAAYDEGGFSFSPYFLSEHYRSINYGSDFEKFSRSSTAADDTKPDIAPKVTHLDYRTYELYDNVYDEVTAKFNGRWRPVAYTAQKVDYSNYKGKKYSVTEHYDGLWNPINDIYKQENASNTTDWLIDFKLSKSSEKNQGDYYLTATGRIWRVFNFVSTDPYSEDLEKAITNNHESGGHFGDNPRSGGMYFSGNGNLKRNEQILYLGERRTSETYEILSSGRLRLTRHEEHPLDDHYKLDFVLEFIKID